MTYDEFEKIVEVMVRELDTRTAKVLATGLADALRGFPWESATHHLIFGYGKVEA